MTAEPQQPFDDNYPQSWKPRHIKERDAAVEMPAVEAWMSSLTDREFDDLVRRTRR
jgi:hypothetical protein